MGNSCLIWANGTKSSLVFLTMMQTWFRKTALSYSVQWHLLTLPVAVLLSKTKSECSSSGFSDSSNVFPSLSYQFCQSDAATLHQSLLSAASHLPLHLATPLLVSTCCTHLNGIWLKIKFPMREFATRHWEPFERISLSPLFCRRLLVTCVTSNTAVRFTSNRATYATYREFGLAWPGQHSSVPVRSREVCQAPLIIPLEFDPDVMLVCIWVVFLGRGSQLWRREDKIRGNRGNANRKWWYKQSRQRIHNLITLAKCHQTTDT